MTDPISELLAKQNAVLAEYLACECGPGEKGTPDECARCRVYSSRAAVADLLAEWWWAENTGRCSSTREFEALGRECDEYRKRAEEPKP